MKTFSLKIVTPTRELFNGPVEHVDLPGIEGHFGVLANHAPLLSLLDIGVGTFRSPDTTRVFVITGGFAEVSGEGTTVISRSAEFVEEIDVGRAESSRKRAAERLAAHAPGTDALRAQAAFQRAILRLKAIRTGKKS